MALPSSTVTEVSLSTRPGESFSLIVTTASGTVTPSYPPPPTVCFTVATGSAEASSSSAAVTVTFCAAFQVDVEKVSEAGSAVTSVLSVGSLTVTVTSPVGTWDRTMA